MAMKVNRADVWAGELQDVPGGLAHVLAGLAGAGGNVECVIARREASRPGAGMVFVTPIRGKKVQDAARSNGLNPAANIGTVRVEGPDQAGLGAAITKAVADAGINIRGVSSMVMGSRFVAYFGFDSQGDADRAAKIMGKVNGSPKRKTAGKKPKSRGKARKR